MAALSDQECEKGKIHNVDSATSIDWVLTKRPMIALYLISCLGIAYTAEAFFNRLYRLVRGTNLPDGEELARIVLSCCIFLRFSPFCLGVSIVPPLHSYMEDALQFYYSGLKNWLSFWCAAVVRLNHVHVLSGPACKRPRTIVKVGSQAAAEAKLHRINIFVSYTRLCDIYLQPFPAARS